MAGPSTESPRRPRRRNARGDPTAGPVEVRRRGDTPRARAPSVAVSGAAAARAPGGPSRACGVRHRLPGAARQPFRFFHQSRWGRSCESGAIMTPEAISRIRSSFSEISSEPRALASRFYNELFAAALSCARSSHRSHIAAGTFRGSALAGDEESGRVRRATALRYLGAQQYIGGQARGYYRREALNPRIRLSSPAWTHARARLARAIQ